MTRDIPILFSDPMVVQLLAGLKTQTRRIVNPQPEVDQHGLLRLKGAAGFTAPHCLPNPASPCRYGQPGDRLWVREAWRTDELKQHGVDGIRYRADGAFREIENTEAAAEAWVIAHDNGRHKLKWRPSIFMPRWACRLRLEVSAVRVERLLEISEADALAEGISAVQPGTFWWPGAPKNYPTAKEAYLAGWDWLNGEGAAEKNPFCWVVSFSKAVPS